MIKKILTFAAGLLALPLCCASCVNQSPAETDTESVTETETVTEQVTEQVTDIPEPSPYQIPDPYRVDFSTFDEALFSAAFTKGTCAEPERKDNGVIFRATEQSRDPSVFFKMNSMYKAAGYPENENGNAVPFTPEEKKVIVLKIQAEWGGAFEMFYATGRIKNARSGCSIIAVYGGDSEFFGERKTQYLVFGADDSTKGWERTFNDKFRLDYTNYAEEGDEFLLMSAAFCTDLAEAESYISADKVPEPEPPAVEAGYYVCLYEDRLHIPKDNVKGSVYQSLDEAKAACDKQKKSGYRVADEKGNVVYTPYTLLQCDLLREGNYVTVYAKKMKFKYGDSCTNPGINHRPFRTSCDRLVDWILYRAGFTDQPLIQGCVVSNLVTWCQKMGFKKITKVEELQPGDIIFVRPDKRNSPQHVFMLASEIDKNGNSQRYDHGSDTRIMSKQPMYELFDKPEAPFMYAYRPSADANNNIYAKYTEN